MHADDKRLIHDSREFWVNRRSERKWQYCKYCYRNTPTFIFTEGTYGSPEGKSPMITQQLRCCWECGSGIAVVYSDAGIPYAERTTPINILR
jgi:hypothetical protein